MWAVTGVTVSNQYFLPTTFPPRWRPIGSGVLPVTGDVDGDQHSDFVWRNTVTGAVVVWRLNGTDLAAQYGLPTVGVLAWGQVASADFNRDGYPDLVWRNRVTGDNVISIREAARASAAMSSRCTVTSRHCSSGHRRSCAGRELSFRSSREGRVLASSRIVVAGTRQAST